MPVRGLQSRKIDSHDLARILKVQTNMKSDIAGVADVHQLTELNHSKIVDMLAYVAKIPAQVNNPATEVIFARYPKTFPDCNTD